MEPGTVIADRYKLTQQIGEGGMGLVFEATHIAIGKQVAIKFLTAEYAKNKEVLERFYQEARIAGQLGHANICEVIDFGVTDDDLPFIVMELMKGKSLADELFAKQRVHVERALAIMVQILGALDEAHSNGIVHRDLKPENVFLAQVKGQGEVAKLLDFGISKVIRPGQDSMRLTKTGAMIGTPYYMSPEQVRGLPDIDHRTDIYSCGVILYEMITGRVPFGGTTYNTIIFKIAEDPFPEPTEDEGVPGAVTELIRIAMGRTPHERFQTAAEFRKEAARILYELKSGKAAGEPSTRMAVEAPSPEAKPRRRSGIAIAGVLAGVVLITVLGVGGAFLYSKKMKDRASPSTKASPSEVAQAPGEEEVEEETVISDTVKLKLFGMPEDAVVIYKGQEVSGNVIEVIKGDDPVNITVSAPGHVTRELQVVPYGERAVDASLEEAMTSSEEDKTEKKKKGKKKKASEDKPAEKKPKKKLGHDWDYPSG